ncbi:hypothetical protein [Embleya sp. NPDC005971]|uniref:hypothetical protein n=1 Tax=unclassified Embleya TaxID=2699296 RepID=UPI0033FE55F0
MGRDVVTGIGKRTGPAEGACRAGAEWGFAIVVAEAYDGAVQRGGVHCVATTWRWLRR